MNPLLGDQQWDDFGAGMKTEAAKYGINFRMIGPPGDAVDAITMETEIQQAIADKAQAIATWSAIAPAAFDALFTKEQAQGGLIGTVESSTATSKQNFDVGFVYPQWARAEVAFVATRPGVQRVGVLWQAASGPGYPEYVAAFKQAAAATHGKVLVEDFQYDEGDFVNDPTLVSAMLTAHPDINMIVSYNGFPGVMTTIQQHGDKGKVFAVTNVDNMGQAREYAADGIVVGVTLQNCAGIGEDMIDGFVNLWEGKSVPRHLFPGFKIADATELSTLPAGWC